MHWQHSFKRIIGSYNDIYRVQIDIYNNDEDDYKKRCKQFMKLVDYLKPLEHVIVMGDFNNGMIRAKSDCQYADVKEKMNFVGTKRRKNTLRVF